MVPSQELFDNLSRKETADSIQEHFKVSGIPQWYVRKIDVAGVKEFEVNNNLPHPNLLTKRDLATGQVEVCDWSVVPMVCVPQFHFGENEEQMD